MKEIGQRLKELRESIHFSQSKMAELNGTNQASVARFEKGHTSPPLKILLWYADYFDVSMDYIFARTDKPQGKLYEYNPKIERNDPAMQRFVEMCFDPKSPMQDRLKKTLLQMLEEEEK